MTLRILSIALFLSLVGCTSDNQATATTSTDSQPAQEQTQEQTAPPVEVAQNDTPTEPEKPAEPETKTITTYHFTSISERGSIDCDSEGKSEGCGATYSDCGPKRDETYACQTGVHEWSTSREELVK